MLMADGSAFVAVRVGAYRSNQTLRISKSKDYCMHSI